jgi:hypothetical protein
VVAGFLAVLLTTVLSTYGSVGGSDLGTTVVAHSGAP